MAFITNGYVYHTEHDKINVMPKGSLQHTGDNVLTLAKCLGNAQELNDIVVSKSQEKCFHVGITTYRYILGTL